MADTCSGCAQERGREFHTYDELYDWSVSDLDGFWGSVWEHLGVASSTPFSAVLAERTMPGARWFPGARLNWAEHALRLSGRDPNDVIVVGRSQTRDRITLTVAELQDQVARARAGLQRLGVGHGDRVAAFMPNVPEALVALLATASLGAIWTSCAPEFGVRSVVDRFSQVQPTVLLAIDGYRYGARSIDRTDEVAAIRSALPGLRATVALPYLEAETSRIPDATTWRELLASPGRCPSSRCRSTTPSTSSTAPGRPACRNRSSTATAASCSST